MLACSWRDGLGCWIVVAGEVCWMVLVGLRKLDDALRGG